MPGIEPGIKINKQIIIIFFTINYHYNKLFSSNYIDNPKKNIC